MARLVTTLLVVFALVFGTSIAQAVPQHSQHSAMGHMSPHTMPIGSNCMHGMHHKGVPCPMVSCFASVPHFLPAPDFSGYLLHPIATVHHAFANDWAMPGSLTGIDPPVPRLC